MRVSPLRKIHPLQVTIMKAITIKPIASAFLLSTLLATSVSFAQSSATSSVRLYDGQNYDSTTRHSPSSAPIDTNSPTAAGPYATYLMSIGTSREEALKAAYNVDPRHPTSSTSVIVDKLAANQPGPYAKYLIHNGVSQEDALVAAHDVDQRQETIENRFARSTRGDRNVTR